MTILVITTLLSTTAAAGRTDSRATPEGSAETAHTAKAPTVAREFCPDNRIGLVWYRTRTHDYQIARSLEELAGPGPRARGHSCGFVKVGAQTWKARARAARRALERFRRRLADDPAFAICHVFGAYCSEALRVADCESSLYPRAQNGQYLGVFQMGSSERARYGHGSTVLAQARAAWRYFDLSGRDWSPWSCKP